MPAEYDPSSETFNPKDSAAAMCLAVEKLADAAGLSLDSFTGRSFAEIARIAGETYADLPEFWRVWQEWHTPQANPEMGDL